VFERSIILPAFFPNSMESAQHFLKAIKTLKKYDIYFIEFYYKGNDKKTIKEYLISNDIKSIYLGAMAAKQKNLNLSSPNKELREESIQEMKKCIDDAYFYGANSLLVNSGRRPDNGENKVAYEYLKKSLEELLKYIDVSTKDYKLNLTLEPGDTEIDSFSLIGNTGLAIKLVREMREKYNNFGLTMDTSHLRQLDEEPLDAIKKAFSYCHHIHLANCIIKDKSHEFYGDKHPEFGIKGGEISKEEFKNILETIKEIYIGSELIVGLEIIFRKEDHKEEIDYFKNTMENLSSFYKKLRKEKIKMAKENKQKKVVIIHTSDVSVKDLKNLFTELAPEVCVRNIIDDSLLAEVLEKEGVTTAVKKRICAYVLQAETIGADLIFNQCSSVGEAADIAAQLVDVPLVKIDEKMAEVACKTGDRIGVIATLQTTLGPTVRLVKKTAKKLEKEIQITEKLCEGAFDLLRSGDIKTHNKMVIKGIKELFEKVDVIVCAQGSMVPLLKELGETPIPVLTSPRLGVERAVEVLKNI